MFKRRVVKIDRIDALREKMSGYPFEAFFTFFPQNIRFLSCFSGSSGAILVTSEKSYFFTDARYIEQADYEVEGFQIVETKKYIDDLVKTVNSLEVRRLGFEGDRISFSQYSEVKKALKSAALVPSKNFIEEIREIKNTEEISCITKAAEISALSFINTLPFIKDGVTEKEVAARLEYELSHNGSERAAFETIVASGKRGALPHGVASNKKINNGEMVTVDFGATCNGYHSDCTRTLFVGRVDSLQKDIYNIVCSAQAAAIGVVKAGVTAHYVDRAARSFIAKSGYGDRFGHGTGHGVGLEVHEGPVIKEGQETELRSGMVITVEPGIYIPGWGGVRVEDMVLVGESGCSVLTSSVPKTGQRQKLSSSE